MLFIYQIDRLHACQVFSDSFKMLTSHNHHIREDIKNLLSTEKKLNQRERLNSSFMFHS